MATLLLKSSSRMHIPVFIIRYLFGFTFLMQLISRQVVFNCFGASAADFSLQASQKLSRTAVTPRNIDEQ